MFIQNCNLHGSLDTSSPPLMFFFEDIVAATFLERLLGEQNHSSTVTLKNLYTDKIYDVLSSCPE